MHAKHQEIYSTSDRSFGLTIGGILALIEAWRFYSERVLDGLGLVLLFTSGTLIVLGLVYPTVLAPINKAWMRLGLIMSKVVNPLVMLAIYILVIIPTGLLMRASGKDPLRLKLDKKVKTYWIERDPDEPSPDSMKNQF